MIPGFTSLAVNMTTREYLASVAMLGLLSQHVTEISESGIPCQEPLFQGDTPRLIKRAIETADALIVSLGKDGSK